MLYFLGYIILYKNIIYSICHLRHWDLQVDADVARVGEVLHDLVQLPAHVARAQAAAPARGTAPAAGWSGCAP